LEVELFAGGELGSRIYAGDELGAVRESEVDDDFVAHEFYGFDGGWNADGVNAGRDVVWVVDAFGTDAEDNGAIAEFAIPL